MNYSKHPIHMQGSKQSICDGYIMELLLGGGLSLVLGKVWCSAVGGK